MPKEAMSQVEVLAREVVAEPVSVEDVTAMAAS